MALLERFDSELEEHPQWDSLPGEIQDLYESEAKASGSGRLSTDVASRSRRARGALALFWLNLVVVCGLFVFQGESNPFTVGGMWNTVGRLTGLVGTNLILVQIILIARTPSIERAFGFDRLAKWHASLGRTAFSLIVAHVGFIVVGYSQVAQTSLLTQAISLPTSTRDMLMATVSFGLLILIVGTSVKIARSKLRRETWAFIHLYSYGAAALAVPHMISSGADFVQNPLTQVYWGLLYTLAIVVVLFFRVGQPLYTLAFHDLRVERVVRETPDVVSIYMSSKRREFLGFKSGQFFIWRFLCRGQWFQAHPYSVSSVPNSDLIRITVKGVGDGSREIANIEPGTRVLAEGPFGAFTGDRRTRRRVLMIAGGVGVTPLRAMLESMPAEPGDITFMYRIRDYTDAVFYEELRQIANSRGVDLQMVVGRSEEHRDDLQPLSANHLASAVPDIADCDVFVCGPEGLIRTVISACGELDVPKSQVHYESFEM